MVAQKAEYPAVKKVNVIPQRPISTVNPPIRSAVRRVHKPVEDIRKCLIGRAIVEEILPDGSTLTLDFSNYDKDNRPSKKDTAIDDAKKRADEAAALAAKEKEEADRKAAEEEAELQKMIEEEEAKKKAEQEAAAKQQEEEKVETADIEKVGNENTANAESAKQSETSATDAKSEQKKYNEAKKNK